MFVVVHSGSRDHYQVALSLYESGRLSCLVTDYYYHSSDIPEWIHKLIAIFLSKLTKRSHPQLPGKYVVTSKRALLFSLLSIAFSHWRSLSNRLLEFHDFYLALKARNISISNQLSIIAYSTYAYVCFEGNPNSKTLFLMHPYCLWTKQRLLYAHQLTPQYSSLINEYEFTLSNDAFDRLAKEPYMSDRIICASTCSLNSLPLDVTSHTPHLVAPYGSRFRIDNNHSKPSTNQQSPVHVISWGGLSERKRFSSFLSLSEQLDPSRFTLHIAYHSVYDDRLLRDLRLSPNVTLHHKPNNLDLQRLLSTSDILFFPSWLEGFGHVVLEAMTFGIVPIVSEYTCGPDIISNSVDGFVLNEACEEDALQYLRELENDRSLLATMQAKATHKAMFFSETRFRNEILTFLLSQEA